MDDNTDNNLDNLIEQYVEQFVGDIMTSPSFASLSDDQKQAKKEEISNYFYERILDLAINEMNEEQLKQLDALDFTTPEAAQKMEELTAQIPNFAFVVEDDFSKQAEVIKQTGKLPEADTQTPAVS